MVDILTYLVLSLAVNVASAFSKDAVLCKEILDCPRTYRLRIDNILNGNSSSYLERLRLNCNSKVKCTYNDIGCKSIQNLQYRVRYSCIETISHNVCSRNTIHNKSGNFFSQRYPSKLRAEIICRFHFNTRFSRDLEFHDKGFNISKLRVHIWYMQNSKWNSLTLFAKEQILHLPNSAAYSIYFKSSRVWFSFHERGPGKKVLKPCQKGDKTTTGNCETYVPQENPYPAPPGLNKCRNNTSELTCRRKNSESINKASTTILISTVIASSFILVVVVAIIWKRCRMSTHRTVQRRQTDLYSRPDVSSIYVNPVTITNCQLSQDNEESHIYEKITSIIYFDPQATLKYNDSDEKISSGIYCQPQATLKNIDSDDRNACRLYWEPQTLKDTDKENSTPIYVNIL